jgi:uncharacterized membrane protein YtjA (UPF0391 family)
MELFAGCIHHNPLIITCFRKMEDWHIFSISEIILFINQLNYLSIMLKWTVIFLIVAIIAGVLGFGGIAAGAAGIAKILFFVFLVLFVLSLISRGVGRS